MRERFSHRHHRITGQITGRVAAWLLVLPVVLSVVLPAVLSAPAGVGVRADDIAATQTRVPTDIQAGVQAGNALDQQNSDDADQLFILGQNRESGEWVRPNPVEAYMWYLLAAMAGHDRAPTARERIAAEMTVEQIAAAWSRAGRCLVTGYLYCDERADP